MNDDTTPRITIEPVERTVSLYHAGHAIAISSEVLCLVERGYPPRFYWPRESVAGAQLAHSATHTHCPFKGDARYFDLCINGVVLTDAAWSYEQPINDVAAIAHRLAFSHPALTPA